MNIKTIVLVFILVFPLSEAIAAETDWCHEYVQKKEYDRAIEACSSGIASGKYDESNLAIIYSNRGVAYSDKGDFDRAIADYTRAIELDPKSAMAYDNRGSAYKSKGDYDRAIADLTRAIELGPKYAVAYYNRGNAYYDKGDYDRAIDDLTKAIELDPKGADAHSNRGSAYKAKGDYDRAIADYTKAIELDPKHVNAYTNRGSAYQDKGDYDRAIDDLTRAIELDPKDADAHNNRGIAFKDKGDYDRAITDYTRTIELDPNYAKAYNNRGSVYKIKSDYDRAITDYTKAIELDPKSVNAYNGRGNAYKNKGDNDRAITDYTKAIELDPKKEYTRIWLLISLRNVSKDRAKSYLEEFRTKVNSNSPTEWVRTISKYYLRMDGLTEKGVLEEARRGKDDNEIRGRLCEAYYYLGEERLWKGNKKGAKEYFQKSIETALYDFTEYQAAKAMLKQRASAPKVPNRSRPKISQRKGKKVETMADAVLRHLIQLKDYRDLQALYDEKKEQAWVISAEGEAVTQWLENARKNAATVTYVTPTGSGRQFQYSILGEKITDTGISIADLERSIDYRERIADIIASNIISNPPDAKVQAALDRFRAMKKTNAAGIGDVRLSH